MIHFFKDPLWSGSPSLDISDCVFLTAVFCRALGRTGNRWCARCERLSAYNTNPAVFAAICLFCIDLFAVIPCIFAFCGIDFFTDNHLGTVRTVALQAACDGVFFSAVRAQINAAKRPGRTVLFEVPLGFAPGLHAALRAIFAAGISNKRDATDSTDFLTEYIPF